MSIFLQAFSGDKRSRAAMQVALPAGSTVTVQYVNDGPLIKRPGWSNATTRRIIKWEAGGFSTAHNETGQEVFTPLRGATISETALGWAITAPNAGLPYVVYKELPCPSSG